MKASFLSVLDSRSSNQMESHFQSVSPNYITLPDRHLLGSDPGSMPERVRQLETRLETEFARLR
jgi:hypothetical protein